MRKYPTGLQFFIGFLKCQLGCTDANRQHPIDIKLIAAVSFIDRHLAAQDNLHAVFRCEVDFFPVAAKHDGIDYGLLIFGRVIIFKRKVLMACSLLKVGQLANDPKIFLQIRIKIKFAFDIASQLINRQAILFIH